MKLGCLPYLNIKPLVYTLEHDGLPEGWELVYAPPSRLAQMLADHQITAAPVSAFATFVNPELNICPGICVAADGPVKSVLMLSKKPIEELDTIALDTSSLSGACMLRILLKELYNLEPQFVRSSPDCVPDMLNKADAALVIGNPAMTCSKEGLHVFDLAGEWKKLTGLPAVFAVWAGSEISSELIDVLTRAKNVGLTKLDEIALNESERLGLPFEVCDEYLKKIMVYDLGERELQGLDLFRRKALEHGLASVEALDI